MTATPEAFEGKPEGWKFTASFEKVFADPGEIHRQRCTYVGAVEHHGYQMENGAWCLQESESENLPKSYRAKVKCYRHRRWRWLVLDSVVEIEEGWN